MTAWTFFNNEWHEGNPMIMGPMTHAPWLGSCVFDGARAFEGVAPDLDQHCQRLVNSARAFGLNVIYSAEEIEALAREGIAQRHRRRAGAPQGGGVIDHLGVEPAGGHRRSGPVRPSIVDQPEREQDVVQIFGPPMDARYDRTSAKRYIRCCSSLTMSSGCSIT